ncbi:MAG: hypothetical protein EB127_05490 [Alphaproteobacteria bacterium]|nr:hypothetical protein [Alphaproteobacteria bacterium]
MKQIIDNVFQIQKGDIMQILENGKWENLGIVNNAREAAIDMGRNNFTVMGKLARLVREVK